jgi:hypothetical protein
VRKVQDDRTNTLRGDRQYSTAGKHIQPQPDTAPKRQQTISSFHPSTKSGGQEQQEHHGKQPAERDLQALRQRAQTANKYPSSHATKQHSNHIVRDSGSQKSHDAGLSDKHHPHYAAPRSSASQSSHQAKVPKEPTKPALTGATRVRNEFESRLVASFHGQQQQQQSLHQHPASQRVQTQTRAQIPPPSSSSSLAHKQEQRDKKEHLARLAKGEEDDLWSDRNVLRFPLRNLSLHVSNSRRCLHQSFHIPNIRRLH